MRSFPSFSLPKCRSSLRRSPSRMSGTLLPWAPRGSRYGSGLISGQRRKVQCVLRSRVHPGNRASRCGFTSFHRIGPVEGTPLGTYAASKFG